MRRAEEAKARALVFLPFLAGLLAGRLLPMPKLPAFEWIWLPALLAAVSLAAFSLYGTTALPLLAFPAGVMTETRASELVHSGALFGREVLALSAFVLLFFLLAVRGIALSGALRQRRSMPPRAGLFYSLAVIAMGLLAYY